MKKLQKPGNVSNAFMLWLVIFLNIHQGIGYASMFVTIYSMIPYMLIMAWGILFLGHSFTTGPLPWTTCGKSYILNTYDLFTNAIKNLKLQVQSNDQQLK